MSQFYTETHNRGMKDLSKSAASGTLGLSWLDPSIFSPPAVLACRGRSAGSFSFSQAAQQKCLRALRTKENRKMDTRPLGQGLVAAKPYQP